MGEAILRLAIVEKFPPDRFEMNGDTGSGADCYITLSDDKKAAIEVKFWINTSDRPIKYSWFKSEILSRFDSVRNQGYRKYLVLFGRKPPNWVKEVSWWCIRNRIQPFYVYIEDERLDALSELLGYEGESPIETFADEYYNDLRAVLLLILSLVNGEPQDLTDEEWRSVESSLPKMSPRGGSRASTRTALNGVLSVLSEGLPWSGMPPRYGSFKTAHRYYYRWVSDGHWEMILGALAKKRYGTKGT